MDYVLFFPPHCCAIRVVVSESADSLCRDGADTPIVRVHRKAFLIREYLHSKPFWAPSYSMPAFLNTPQVLTWSRGANGKRVHEGGPRSHAY